jgi:phage host-nuclease inhibitor protein Gam
MGRQGGVMAQKAGHPVPTRSAKRSSKSAKRSPEELRTWEQVDQRLASLGEAARQIRSLQDQFGQKMAVLKQQWLEACHPLLRDKEKIECQIERFYWAHRDEVLARGRKSVDLVFGRLGSRHRCCVVVRDAAAAMEWLRDNGLERYLHTRTVLDREALRSALAGTSGGAAATDGKDLVRCPNIHLHVADEFWYAVEDSRLDDAPLPGARLQPSSVRSPCESNANLGGGDPRGGEPALELCVSTAANGHA